MNSFNWFHENWIERHWDEYTMDVIGRVAMGQRGTRQFRNPYTRFCADVLLSEGNNWEEWVGWLFPAIGTFLHHAGLQFKTLHDDLFPRFLDVILKAVEKRRVSFQLFLIFVKWILVYINFFNHPKIALHSDCALLPRR